MTKMLVAAVLAVLGLLLLAQSWVGVTAEPAGGGTTPQAHLPMLYRPLATATPTTTPTATPTLTPSVTPTATPTLLPTASFTPSPTPTSQAPGNCTTCASDTYNCSDFDTQAQAQACFDYCWEQVGFDVHNLDSNGDGEACESLPLWEAIFKPGE